MAWFAVAARLATLNVNAHCKHEAISGVRQYITAPHRMPKYHACARGDWQPTRSGGIGWEMTENDGKLQYYHFNSMRYKNFSAHVRRYLRLR